MPKVFGKVAGAGRANRLHFSNPGLHSDAVARWSALELRRGVSVRTKRFRRGSGNFSHTHVAQKIRLNRMFFAEQPQRPPSATRRLDPQSKPASANAIYRSSWKTDSSAAEQPTLVTVQSLALDRMLQFSISLRRKEMRAKVNSFLSMQEPKSIGT
jgi:hypothetical protein